LQLFKRRPLCFFCFVFAAVCLIAAKIGLVAKLWISVAVILLVIATAICLFVTKRYRTALFYLLFTLSFILVAMLSSLFGIDLPQRRAEGYVGEHAVKLCVLDKEYSSEYSSEYTVKLENVDGEKASINTRLLLNFKSDIDVGDTVYANASLSRNEDSNDNVLLVCVVDGEGRGLVKYFDRDAPIYEKLVSKNGARVILSEVKNAVSDRANKLLGPLTGSLACGFLIGDTENIPDIVIRDFRRSGVSHLLAVSGMHISILLGAVELLFRRFYIPKSIRCVTVSLLAFLLLCLTGFSMSAMRAVLMLWITYLIFMLSEEADAPTVLFAALFVMLLTFPYAVSDVGMWMSFLATLGLVTLYKPVYEKLPETKSKNRFVKLLWAFGRLVILAIVITVISNMFLMYIMCTVFGEVSISAIPANLLLSPISTVFMFACVTAMIFGSIPFVGTAFCFLCVKLGELITLIAKIFSRFEWSVVSLRPTFARIIVIAFSISLAVMLVIKLKRKWMFAAIPLAFAVAFGACYTVRLATYDTCAVYNYTRGNETVYISDGSKACIVDMSNGAYSHYFELINDVEDSGATEVETIVFTNVSKKHLSTMNYIFRNKLVRSIFIPYPTDDQIDISIRMTELAYECGVSVSLYDDKPVKILDGVYICADIENSAWLVSSGKQVLGYVDVEKENSSKSLISNADTVIFGGVPCEEYYADTKIGAKAIYSSSDVFDAQRSVVDYENTYVNIYDKLKLRIKLE